MERFYKVGASKFFCLFDDPENTEDFDSYLVDVMGNIAADLELETTDLLPTLASHGIIGSIRSNIKYPSELERIVVETVLCVRDGYYGSVNFDFEHFIIVDGVPIGSVIIVEEIQQLLNRDKVMHICNLIQNRMNGHQKTIEAIFNKYTK